jgi:vacuolar-type H+-ATPase subunit I/STV1
MGKQLNLLRKLIKEELEIALAEETTDKPSSNGADYDQLEELNEEAMDDIVDYLIDEDLSEEEEIDEAKGRTKGTGKLFTLKGGKDVEDVKKFLTKIQSLISKKGGRGRKPLNFTDEDIESFSELLTRKEGFGRQDIIDTISFYKGKPFQAAQKMMDVLGDKKLTSKVDIKGNPIEIGKGYLETIEGEEKPKAKKEKEVVNTDTEEVDVDEFEDAEDGEIDDIDDIDDFEDSEVEIDDEIKGGGELAQLRKDKDRILAKFKSGELSMDEYKKEIGDIPSKIKKLEKEMADDLYINEDTVRMFQKRAGLLNG